jgi:uncharacterized membrane protein HdeD (DUF308 family)
MRNYLAWFLIAVGIFSILTVIYLTISGNAGRAWYIGLVGGIVILASGIRLLKPSKMN